MCKREILKLYILRIKNKLGKAACQNGFLLHSFSLPHLRVFAVFLRGDAGQCVGLQEGYGFVAWGPNGEPEQHVLIIHISDFFFSLFDSEHNVMSTRSVLFQSVMNRIHTITVPYAVMKACPMSWVQRVHIHKGSAGV